MDARDFDRLTRTVSTRRTLAALLDISSIGVSGQAGAKKNRKQKKVKRNDLGCVNVGKFCKNDSQCCSGVCEGKKKRKKCKPHDESTCQPGQDSCLGAPIFCTTTAGFAGICVTTSGKAPYCYASGEEQCFPCSKDSDCEPGYGAGAACIVCATFCANENPQATACVGTAAPL